jgi:RimJ/RimL family protein N-acetyltransferase
MAEAPRLVNFSRGEKVYLSPMTKEDVPTITAWYQDSEFMRLLDAIPANPKPPTYSEGWIEKANTSKTDFSFGIRLVDGDGLIGLIELEEIDYPNSVAWLSVGIGDKAYWGGGYGSEAIELLLRFAFDELNLHRVQLDVFDYNERAIAAYEKIGFVREGTWRENIQRDGRRYNTLLYGLLRREWEARRKQ